jgi:hypothetical protein
MASPQGRRELGDRSVFLFHPPTPSCQDSSITGGTLQGDGRLRTTPGEKRVSARRGRAGEKSDFFNILLMRWRQHRYDAQRAAGPTGNFHREGDHVESLIRKSA